ncbi:hypothetical protein GCM10028784_38250 [Myceligenerans cantabricum]
MPDGGGGAEGSDAVGPDDGPAVPPDVVLEGDGAVVPGPGDDDGREVPAWPPHPAVARRTRTVRSRASLEVICPVLRFAGDGAWALAPESGKVSRLMEG